jgi:hypothetical protein
VKCAKREPSVGGAADIAAHEKGPSEYSRRKKADAVANGYGAI